MIDNDVSCIEFYVLCSTSVLLTLTETEFICGLHKIFRYVLNLLNIFFSF